MTMSMFFFGMLVAVILIVIAVALAPIIWLLCGGSFPK